MTSIDGRQSRAPRSIATVPIGLMRTRLPLVSPPTLPEIRLHQAGPGSGVARLAGVDAAPPYWAYCWAGGLALARHLLDHPQTVAGLRVLDLGAGSGVVAIAAAIAGARKVTAADVDVNAVTATTLNARANGVDIETLCEDLTAKSPPPVDVIAAGDLFYEEGLAERVTGFLDRCAAAGIPVLVGDPRRRHLPLPRLRLLAEYDVPDFGDGEGTRQSAVYAFVPASSPITLAAGRA